MDTIIRIRKATRTDSARIAKVHVKAWQYYYKDTFPKDYLNQLSIEQKTINWEQNFRDYPDTVVLVAEKYNEIVGFVCGGIPRDKDVSKDTAEIYAIYLSPGYDRQGLGTLLMEAIMKDLKIKDFNTFIIWVLETNTMAQNFYKKMKFQKEEKTKFYSIGDEKFKEVRYKRRAL